MAAGLGYEFFDKYNHLLQAKGISLDRVARISADNVPAILENLDIQILTDVTNPLCGENGATYVFGGQ
ncbi:glycerate kinase, partial [Actinotignum timonense]|nr:glycerate kinase [Actinotignum timonense]